jgi:antitoxin component YwqK of YwqJK toxin-antitoxin module
MQRFLTLMYVAENDGKEIFCETPNENEIIYYTKDNKIIIQNLKENIIKYSYIDLIEKNGYTKEFYPDGSLKYHVPIVNGLLNGEYHLFYETGELRMKTFFINDKINGLAIEYYRSGNIRYSIEMNNSLMNGVRKIYNELQKLYSEEVYQNGVLLRKRTYYENGAICQDNLVRDNHKHGTCKGYYPSGTLKYSRHYVDGKKHGTEVFWDQGGNQIVRNKYKDDVKI